MHYSTNVTNPKASIVTEACMAMMRIIASVRDRREERKMRQQQTLDHARLDASADPADRARVAEDLWEAGCRNLSDVMGD